MGVQLFRRAYVLSLKISGREQLRIRDLDIAFEVVRTAEKEPNTCEISIRNLREDHRRQLEERKAVTVELSAGYERPPGVTDAAYSSASLIFSGDLRDVYTSTTGPDLVTHLSSGDGEKAQRTKRVNKSFGPGTSIRRVVEECARAMGVGLGNLSGLTSVAFKNVGDVFHGGTVLSGHAAYELTAILRSAGLEWSIQNGVLQVLPRGGALAGEAIVLSSDTGLIESPSIASDGVLRAKTLMIPDLFPGRVVELRSLAARGRWAVRRCEYKGDTSPGGEWTVEIEAKQQKRKAT